MKSCVIGMVTDDPNSSTVINDIIQDLLRTSEGQGDVDNRIHFVKDSKNFVVMIYVYSSDAQMDGIYP